MIASPLAVLPLAAHWHHGGGWWCVFIPVVWALIAVGVFLLVRRTWPGPPQQPQQHRDGPLDLLARRFAAGEIDAEEYERRRDVLGG